MRNVCVCSVLEVQVCQDCGSVVPALITSDLTSEMSGVCVCFVLGVQVCQDCGSVLPPLSVPHDMQMLMSKHAAWQGLCTWHAKY